MNQKTYSRSINVSLRVIADLSQGLYRSPADALKELVSNAYDADSPIVEIIFSSDFSTIFINDEGHGININDFIEIMETIGGSSKRSEDTGFEEITNSGRKIIGRIGIGLLSVSQIASELEITSTQAGSDRGLYGKIQFDQFASEKARKIKITEIWEEDKELRIGEYQIKEITGVEKDIHFTKLKLNKVKPILKNKLYSYQEKDGQQKMLGKSLNTAKELILWMKQNKITKNALHEYDRMFWELCILCPVPYEDNSIKVINHIKSSSNTESFIELANDINEETHLVLKYDGIQAFKPIQMPDDIDKQYQLFFNLLFMKGLNNTTISYVAYDDNGKPIENELKLKGYIYYQRPNIWPPELRGLLIRVRNVAIGQYDSTFLTYKHHEAMKFSQLSGEIYVDNLDIALNIDRASFRETEPAFIAFRDSIHSYLNKTVFPGIKVYSAIERKDRNLTKLASEIINLQQKFKDIDSKKREFHIESKQNKLVVRDENEVKMALSIDRKKILLGNEFYRIIAFIEAKLSEKLSDEERDNLYEEMISWLIEFE